MSGRGWFEGTMEVISGTVGRSSTPTPPYRPSVSHSAPSSPCPRSPGGYSIQRLPSQDTLDRSIHNDSSHGKSRAQIIKDLRASNAALTAKTAEMEADFMNQVNKVTMKYEYQNKELHEALKQKDKKISTLESRTLSTENRIRDRDSQLSKLKEENTFQRQSIADLKTQLYQLQSEIDDGEYEDGEDWVKEKRDLLREVEGLKRQVADLSQNGSKSSSSTPRGMGDDHEVLQSWKQLEETKKRLEEAQSALALADKVSKRKSKEHEEEILVLRAKHAAAVGEWTEKERELRSQLEALESDDIELTKDLRAQVEERDLTVINLRADVEQYSSQVQELTMEVAQAKASLENQDRYRREEAEDLRILNDAQEEENRRLRETIEELKAGMGIDSLLEVESDERISKLESELEESRDACDSLERKLEDAHIANEEQVTDLREELGKLKEEKEKAESKYEQHLTELEAQLEESQQRSAQEENEALYEEKVREVESKAEQQREDLEKDFEEQKESWEKAKREEIAALEKQLAEAKVGVQEPGDVDELKTRLDGAETKVKEKDARVSELQQKVKGLETKATMALRAKKQLREAQIALVAIDDEKKKNEQKHREQIETLEKEKNTMEADFRAQLAKRDTELESQKPRDSVQVAGLAEELMKLKTRMKEREAEHEETKAQLVHANKTRSLTNGHGPPEDEQIDKLRKEKEQLEKELTEKLNDRDTTITTLLKTSVTQEQKVASLQEELEIVRARLAPETFDGDELMGPTARVGGGLEVKEVNFLRRSLEEYKRVEDNLSQEILELKSQLKESELEAARLRERTIPNGVAANDDNEGKDKLQERDEAISTLVKESLAHEAEISALKRVIKRLEKSSGPSWEELERLQRESEIFAGQIIEQDEEMEVLKGELSNRETQIHALVQDLKQNRNVSSDSNQIMDLRAELDEVKESNDTHVQELRDLRKQLRAKQAAADKADDLKIELYHAQQALDKYKQRKGISNQEDIELRQKLDEALKSKEALAERMSEQMESVRRLRNTAVASLEAQVKERDTTIGDLERELSKVNQECSDVKKEFSDAKKEFSERKEVHSSNDEKVDQLQLQVGRLRMELEEKEMMVDDAQVAVQELRRALDQRTTPEVVFQEKEALTREIGGLKSELTALEEDKKNISELRQKLSAAEEDRDSWERGIVDSYERKISLLKLDKDVTIDGLRKELAEFRAKETFDQEDVVNEINALEAHNKDLEDEFEAKLRLKDSKVEALEQALHAQEQLIDNMRSEMDQLQTTMERANTTRRAEIEEMQQEAFESSSKATQYEREVAALKRKIEESESLHRNEVEKLTDKISSLESEETPVTKSMSDLQQQEYDDRLDQVKERLEKLQWRNNSLQDENVRLRGRLDKAESETMATKDDKTKIATLEDEVSSLSKKIKDMELDTKMTVSKNLQVVTPSPKEQTAGSRRSRKNQSMSPRRTSASPGRLRFLKRRNHSKDFGADELKSFHLPPPAPQKDTSTAN